MLEEEKIQNAGQKRPGAILTHFRPNHQKTNLSWEVGRSIIRAKIEEHLSYFDSPLRVLRPYSINAMVSAAGTGIRKHVPSEKTVWDIVTDIDVHASDYMLALLQREPGNVTIGFDGVTALGKHAILYTFSKGKISLFLTIR